MKRIDPDMAELLGMYIGDGCISRTKRYAMYYLGGDLKEEREYHDNWVGPLFNEKISQPILNKDVNYKERPKMGIYGFNIFNEEVVKFFEELGINAGSKINVEVPKQILKTKSLAKRFLRGLFDTDGTIYFDKNVSAKEPINNRPKIRLCSVSEILIKQVSNLLSSANINSRIRKPYKGKRDKNKLFSIQIERIGDVNKFIEEIDFKNSKHKTKWLVYKKLGYCKPYSTLLERKQILAHKKL